MLLDEIEEVIRLLEAAPARFQAALGRMEDADSVAGSAPGEWSPSEVLAHVRASNDILEPRLFPVVDRAVMGSTGGSYQGHFEKVQRHWLGTAAPTRSHLHEAMRALVRDRLAPNFPLTNKAVELCLIGRHNVSRRPATG